MSLFRSFTDKVKQFFPLRRKPSELEFPGEFDFRRFETIIGQRIHRSDLFLEALLHRSYLQYQSLNQLKSNERLEFLGDSILNLIVAEYLYSHFPDSEEGELTKLRSRLVSRRALAIYARQLNLEDFMFMSSSAAQSLEKGSDSMLADAYEAVIAAIYIDSGYEAAKRFVEKQVLGALYSGTIDTSDQNYKSLLLEYAQGHGLGIPKYNVLKEEGPDHDRTFTVEVSVGDQTYGVGVGKSKKEAEQSAAMRALSQIENENPSQSQ